jgi:hypothetical protein
MHHLSKKKIGQGNNFLKDSSIGFAIGAFVVLGVFIYSLYSFAAWTNPSVVPTGGNVPAPINVGSSTQARLGTLRLGTTTAPASVSNLFLYKGGLSIATTTMVANQLTIEGSTSVVQYNGGGYIRGVENPFDPTDAINKGYADAKYALASQAFWTGLLTGNISNLNTGNVGIGVTVPLSKLEVTGASAATDPGNGTTGIFSITSGTGLSSDDKLEFGVHNTDYSWIQAVKAGTGWRNLVLEGTGGNVGIGTANPASALDVQGGDLNVSGQGRFKGWYTQGNGLAGEIGTYLGQVYVYSYNRTNSSWSPITLSGSTVTLGHSASTDLFIDSSGNVGIGTATPGAPLHVYNTIGSSGDIVVQNTLASSYTQLGFTGTGRKFQIGVGNASEVAYGVANKFFIYDNPAAAMRMVIDQNGNMGVGTTSPAFKLDVKGAGRFTGSLGVATSTSGTYALDVKGLVRTSANVYIGGQIFVGAGDLAEDFYTDKIYPVGTVLVMDDQGYKSARACDKKYDQTVIGVISENPALEIGHLEGKYKAPVALNGVVKVLVNATGGKIKQGDLLTTSAVSGEAMKATNPKVGTSIGKALEDDAGKGWIMAIVNLK